MTTAYLPAELDRTQVDALPGTTLLDFGTNWCGHCSAAAPMVAAALASFPDIRHLRIEDGPGRPLGRSYKVKLWPTLIVLSDGREQARVVRPHDIATLSRALASSPP